MIPSVATTPVRDAYLPTSWQARWLRVLYSLPPDMRWRQLTLWLRKPLKNVLGQRPDIAVGELSWRLHSCGNPAALLDKASYRLAGKGLLSGIYRLDP